MGGLAIATVLTLVFLPTLYIVWFRIKEPQTCAPEPLRCELERAPSTFKIPMIVGK
jgi:hypothetical protein